MKYRREIDGLRTMAVLPVILFHAGVPLFKGGFVGVDVFFVISGYLITSIILSEVEQGKFSLVTFYERRFRRILPALFFVLACTWVLVSSELMASEMKAFSQSIAAVTVFSSNMLFWWTSGYFDVATELKPLLHTWSLGIEEQYYFFFPLLILLLWRIGFRKSIAWVLFVIAVVSLIAAEWMVHRTPMSAFYLLPFRAWELLAGSLIACYFQHYKQSEQSKMANQLGSLAGMALLLIAIFLYDKYMVFPGVSALVPVAGAALIIIFATPKTWVGKFLSIQPMVQIGLISYSAYLWHNPLFALARIKAEFHADLLTMLGLSLLSLVLAYFTWKYVEAPFRNKNLFLSRKIFIYSFFGSVMLFIVGIVGHFYFQSREIKPDYQWDQFARRHQCLIQNDNATQQEPSCYVDKRNEQDLKVLLWGDSHAASLYQGLSTFAEKNNIALTQLNQSACPPILGWNSLLRLNCSVINERILKEITQTHYDVIFLHSMWYFEKAPTSVENIATGLDNTIEQIKKASPKSKIIVIANVPRWYISAERAYFRAERNNEIPQGELYRRAITFPELENALRQIAQRQQVGFIAPSRYLCKTNESEYGECFLSADGSREKMLYTDGDHLSKTGADILVEKMTQDLKLLISN
ncbi:acyltransferase family protein [Glaesserella sp.]|uniref:acyltransferase family protein n=1 Tax=Glaesserella sp. TaxID=2094731 RepID=UPI00359F9542